MRSYHVLHTGYIVLHVVHYLCLLFLHDFYTFLRSSHISHLMFSFDASLAVFMPHFPAFMPHFFPPHALHASFPPHSCLTMLHLYSLHDISTLPLPLYFISTEASRTLNYFCFVYLFIFELIRINFFIICTK